MRVHVADLYSVQIVITGILFSGAPDAMKKKRMPLYGTKKVIL